jgi:ubiquinone/menaquinone biosynthesis C-methylase UbiE/DNA-binding transcriptional ArsR family regulator
MEKLLSMLRAAGDPTRLRLLVLLARTELTVSEITAIMGQSQPRVSRHLKLLCDAGFLERVKEGAWVFYRGRDRGQVARLAQIFGEFCENDSVQRDDLKRLAQIREERAREAAGYFASNAAQWEKIRALHVPETEVEASVIGVLQRARLERVLDAGTGTGRILELLSPYIERGIGIDSSPEMLTIARDRLAKAGSSNCQVRRGDVYRLPFPDATPGEGFDAVVFHQVLHFLDDPQAAIREAARVLRGGGRVVIVDFAPHQLEFLRCDYAHRRLGFANSEVEGWFTSAGLQPLEIECLATRSDAEALTVVIWLAQQMAVTQTSHIEAAA